MYFRHVGTRIPNWKSAAVYNNSALDQMKNLFRKFRDETRSTAQKGADTCNLLSPDSCGLNSTALCRIAHRFISTHVCYCREMKQNFAHRPGSSCVVYLKVNHFCGVRVLTHTLKKSLTAIVPISHPNRKTRHVERVFFYLNIFIRNR